MSNTPSQPHGSDSDAERLPIRDRVLTRIRHAELAVDRRAPSRVMRRRKLDAERAAQDHRTPEQRREARALRRVFLDLGDCYREYRRRTGAPVSAEVREAAYHFQQQPDLTSLVSVAASLDRLESLSW